MIFVVKSQLVIQSFNTFSFTHQVWSPWHSRGYISEADLFSVLRTFLLLADGIGQDL